MITYNTIPDNPHSKKGDFSTDPDSEEIIYTEQSVDRPPPPSNRQRSLSLPHCIVKNLGSMVLVQCTNTRLPPPHQKKKKEKKFIFFGKLIFSVFNLKTLTSTQHLFLSDLLLP